MKKTFAAIAAAVLLAAAVFSADWVFRGHVATLQLEKEHPAAAPENPAKPDPESLKELGIAPFVSSVPVIMIDTDSQEIVREEKRNVTLAVYDSAAGENDIQGNPSVVLRGKMKLRGKEGAEKSQYRLNLLKNNSDKERKYPLLGMASDSRWILHGPFADRSLMRNYLMYTLSREAMEWAPDCRFFELFLNGEYQGVYLAVEPVTVSKDRLNLSRFSLISGESPCILYRDHFGEETLPIETYANRNGYIQRRLDLRYPDPLRITDAQKDSIERTVSQFEKALYSPGFTYAGSNYKDYIDTESFADYLILNQFAMNRDMGALSTYVYRDLNGKLQMCVWDFDKALNNYRNPMPVSQWVYPSNTWFQRMAEDPDFLEIVKTRYAVLRAGILSDAHIEQIIEDAVSLLGDAPQRNFLRWKQAYGEYLLLEKPGEPRNAESFSEAVGILKDMAFRRLQFMDRNLSFEQ